MTVQQGRRIPFGRGGLANAQPRDIVILVALAAIVILLLVLIVNGIRGCVSSRNEAKKQAEQIQAESDRPTVAEGIPDDLAGLLSSTLSQNDKLAEISSNANKYPESLVRLALDEPAAIPFVSTYLETSKEARAFDDEVSEGNYPQLYTFDGRWGYTQFADGPFATTGTAPTCISIAFMGLHGATSLTPNKLADMATEDGTAANGEVTPEFFSDTVFKVNGISCTELAPSTSVLTTTLTNNNVMVVKVAPNSAFGSTEHYVLVTGINENQSVSVIDPLSPTNTNREWAMGTVVSATQSMYQIAKTSTPIDA